MRVRVVAHTKAIPQAMAEASGNKWEPEEIYDDGSTLVEFAGRACYQSWSRPNPSTATNEEYVRNIIDQQHLSVLEHGSVTFHIQDVSRSLTHELVRHRHLSFSQLSQRYVRAGDGQLVVPPLYRSEWTDGPHSETQGILIEAWARSIEAYDKLVAIHLPRLIQRGVDPHRARKMAREAARCVLPNMTPTDIVVTGNHRTWREFLAKRASIHADAEIRELAVAIFAILVEMEPAIYEDFKPESLDGDWWLLNA